MEQPDSWQNVHHFKIKILKISTNNYNQPYLSFRIGIKNNFLCFIQWLSTKEPLLMHSGLMAFVHWPTAPFVGNHFYKRLKAICYSYIKTYSTCCQFWSHAQFFLICIKIRSVYFQIVNIPVLNIIFCLLYIFVSWTGLYIFENVEFITIEEDIR